MWTYEKLKDLLDQSGWNWSFLVFSEPQATPYAILRMDDSQNLISDLHFHKQRDTFSLEFYYRNPQDRFQFEKWLTSQKFLWERVSTDNSVGQDDVYLSIYEI